MGKITFLQQLNPIVNSLRDLLPIILVVAFFQLVVLNKPIPNYSQLLIGTISVIIGLALFIRGLELALFPVGESLANAFARKGSLFWLLLFAFSLGFGTTVAEPALIAVANEAAAVAARGGAIADNSEAKEDYAFGLRLTVAISVGAAILLGVFRIIRGWRIERLIV